MAGPRPGTRARLVEVALWLAAAAAGVLVLLPAAVELVEARSYEQEARNRAERAERRAREAGRALEWLEADPTAAERVQEARDAAAREDRASEEPETRREGTHP